MNRTIYRWKTLIADFFNKIPAVILIPGILLASFLIAVLLIWSGTKVAFIDVAEPFAANSNANGNRSPGSGNKNGNFDGDIDFSLNNPANRGAAGSAGSAGADKNDDIGLLNNQGGQNSGGAQESGGESSGGGGSASGDDSLPAGSPPANGDAANISGAGPAGGSQGSSSSSSGSAGAEAAKRLPSYSYGSNDNANSNANSNVSENCTYPGGDVKLWWRRAPKKQRDCYIKKNGWPDFLADEPYFCDYEKNEDCYVK